MSKSVEVNELLEGAFTRLVEINFSKCLFASHFNQAVQLKLWYRYTYIKGQLTTVRVLSQRCFDTHVDTLFALVLCITYYM